MISSLSLKEEILQHPPQKKCCLKSFLNAFLSEGKEKNELDFSSASIGRLLVTLLNDFKLTDWGMGLSKKKMHHSGTIFFGKESSHRLKVDPSFKICCCVSRLRAKFLHGGSFSSPQHRYHLEIRSQSEQEALRIQRSMSQLGIQSGVYFRRNDWVVFLKSGESISRFLNKIKAHKCLLIFEELRAIKETKNQVKRRVNYESANLGRVVEASAKQREAIESIISDVRWSSISPMVKEAAIARLRYANLSLSELAEKLQITKSALNHRLRRLLKDPSIFLRK